MMNHQAQWKKIQLALHEQRVAQAMLFVGPLHCALDDFVAKIVQLFLCNQKTKAPCLLCVDCKMANRMEHPDMEWIKPEKSGGAIKIDQIRGLQNTVYLTPKRAHFKLIIIEGADRMNTASANALLKILEEPAKHTIFILTAQQISTILPTVLSRCQIIPFSAPEDAYRNNLLKLGEQYPPESAQFLMMKQAESLLDGVIALLERREHPCILASQWSQFELSILLWFFYLVYSQLQYMYFNTSSVTGPAASQLVKLLTLLSPVLIFNQIDKINNLLRKIGHNINVNPVLALEDLLFSLASGVSLHA